MGDLLVPAAQRLPGGFLDDGLLVIVAGKSADGVQAGEERNGGEQDLLAILAAQEAGAAKAADRTQMPADLRFEMTLIVISGSRGRPTHAISARSYVLLTSTP